MTPVPGRKARSRAPNSGLPPNLLQFMLRDWKSRPRARIKPIRDAASFRARREKVSRRFAGDIIVIPAGEAKIRANDTHYVFRPGSDIGYLAGAAGPDSVLVLLPRNRGHEHVLFTYENTGKTDATFFTDRERGLLWVGPRLGVRESAIRYAIECKPLTELESTLRRAIAKCPGRVRILRGLSPSLEQLLVGAIGNQLVRDDALASFVAEMRLTKEPMEVRAIARAIRATKAGFEDVVARLETAKSERELEGAFWARARIEGNDVGYPSIVASGVHACTLHWSKNDGALRKGNLLLLDAGVEGESLYTADITRTLPVSGRFTPEQRAVYQIVFAARRAALSCVKPGNDFMAPNKAAMAVLTEGLQQLGVLSVSAEEALHEENQFYRRYCPHSVSHMLGLDVHDCAQARPERYKYGRLGAGMVLTVEPGLYFQPDDLTVPRKYRGIGIRIEDDVLVTGKGHRVLSASLPSEAGEIEEWIRKIWRRSE